MTQKLQTKFVIFLNNQCDEVSLEIGKLYRPIDLDVTLGEDASFVVDRYPE